MSVFSTSRLNRARFLKEEQARKENVAQEYISRVEAERRAAEQPIDFQQLMYIRALAGKATPLEVLLEQMDRHLEAADFDAAVSVAKIAAPYVHPKLAAMVISGDDTKPAVRIDVQSPDHLKSLVRGTAQAQMMDSPKLVANNEAV